MLRTYSLCFLLFIVSNSSLAQDDSGGELNQRFFFGVNVGVKFANKNYANRYGGWIDNELENQLFQVNNYQTIFEILGQKDFTFTPDGYPLIVRYKPGILTGVTMGYKLSPTLQFGLDADFSKLKFNSAYSITVIDPSITVSQEQYRTGFMYAEESRFNGRFNIDYIIGGDPINYVIGLSGLFSAWKIDKHMAIFEEFQMPIFSVHNPANNFNSKTGGTGWGFGLNVGVEYRFSEKIVAQLMYQPYLQRAEYFLTKTEIANLSSPYIKPAFRLEHDLTVRILWK